MTDTELKVLMRMCNEMRRARDVVDWRSASEAMTSSHDTIRRLAGSDDVLP